MKEQDGRLSAADKNKVTAWLNEKGVNHSCPVCGENEWIVGDHLLTGVLHFPDGGMSLGGAAYPTVILVCSNCAYTRHFMAGPIGLLKNALSGGAQDG